MRASVAVVSRVLGTRTNNPPEPFQRFVFLADSYFRKEQAVGVKLRSITNRSIRREHAIGMSLESGAQVPHADLRDREVLHSPVELLGRIDARILTGHPATENAVTTSGSLYGQFAQHQSLPSQVREDAKRTLRIMKFGGTSVGDASCIARVVEIIRSAARDDDVVVVVSAMGGVTNKLIEAATLSEAGDRKAVATIFAELRKQHVAVVDTLISSPEERSRIRQKMQEVFQEGDRLCEGTILSARVDAASP